MAARLTEEAITAGLAQAGKRDEHYALFALAHFQLRERNPQTPEIATFLGWTIERTQAALDELSRAGLASMAGKPKPGQTLVVAERIDKHVPNGKVTIELWCADDLRTSEDATQVMLAQVAALRELATALERIARGN
jgi:hypothetical protein